MFKFSSEKTTDMMVKEEFDRVIDKLIELVPEVNSKLITKGKEKEFKKTNFLKNYPIQDFIKHIIHGFELIRDKLQKSLNQNELEKIRDELLEFEKKKKQWEKEDNPPKFETLNEAIGFSDETLTHFYTIGRGYFEDREWQEASEIFLITTLLDPYVSDFWIALGLSLQNDGKLLQALHAYAMSVLTGHNDNPSAHLYACECYILLGEYDDAELELKAAKELIEKMNLQNQWGEIVKNIEQTCKARRLS